MINIFFYRLEPDGCSDAWNGDATDDYQSRSCVTTITLPGTRVVVKDFFMMDINTRTGVSIITTRRLMMAKEVILGHGNHCLPVEDRKAGEVPTAIISIPSSTWIALNHEMGLQLKGR